MAKAKLLRISQLGDSVLREKSSEITDFKDKELQDLIENMMATLKGKGVGIAAPQVYESKRVFIVASEPNEKHPDAPKMEPTAILNPKIISCSEELEKDWESCLSIPGFYGLVSRHKTIEVEYYTREGEKQTKKFEGFLARIFQHEFDHLNGLVYLDRIDRTKEHLDIATDEGYKNLKKNKKK